MNVSSHFSPELREGLKRYWASPEGSAVDVVLAHRLRMAPAAFEGNPGKPVVLDLTDCLASYSRQAKDQAGFPSLRRFAAWWDHWFLKREETEWGEAASKVLAISPEDARALVENGLGSGKVAVVPNGVEAPARRSFPRPEAYGDGRKVVCFVGNMGYAPNEDAALWFLREVWPRVRAACPGALFAAVGGRPRRALRRLGNGDDILVTGTVPQVEPYLLHADLSVAPLRVAVGMQNKVAQSLAWGVPVVATPQALAWAGEPVRERVLVGTGVEGFAQQVTETLKDPRGARAQASRARAILLKSHRWETSGRLLEAILREAATEGRRA
jgi:glycosyltransferase involved in cell wall biosynthesis